MRIAVATAVVILAAAASHSQSPEDLQIVSGTCDAKSGVNIGGGARNQFTCDGAIITRTARGILIQFADKKGTDGRLLGFAGTIEGKQAFGADTTQAVAVERLYLAGGAQPISVSRGTCFMNWTGLQRTGGRLTSVTCGARGTAEGQDVVAVVGLKVG